MTFFSENNNISNDLHNISLARFEKWLIRQYEHLAKIFFDSDHIVMYLLSIYIHLQYIQIYMHTLLL